MQQTPIQELIEWIKQIDNSVFALSASAVELKMLGSFKTKLASLLTTEQQYIQQHAEGFAEWIGTNVYACDYSIGNDVSWTLHDGVDSNIYTTSELYTKYIEYINSLTT